MALRVVQNRRGARGAVLIELILIFPLLLLTFSAGVACVAVTGARTSEAFAARDLARLGAGYDYDRDWGGRIPSSCEIVCNSAQSTLRSYGLDPATYRLNMFSDGESFSVILSRRAEGIFGSYVMPSHSTLATFDLENQAFDRWDPAGCGTQELTAC